MASFPAARITDSHVCPLCPGAPVLKGEPTVLTGKMPQARIMDVCACVGPPDPIAYGSPTVLVGKMPAARMTDPTAKGGMIAKGEPTVLIGSKGGAGGGLGGGLGQLAQRLAAVMTPICVNLGQQLYENQAAQTDLALADATYDPDAPLPDGYRRATQADLEALNLHDGVTDLTQLPGTDFHSEVFVRTDPLTNQESYVVGFRGTQTAGDWAENIRQGAGMDSAYYNRAAQIGRVADAAAPGRVSYTGHSLGGGLASAAAAVNGGPARTFNAAGLTENTMEQFGANTGGTQAYFLNEDPLSSFQDSTWAADAVGTRRGYPATQILAPSDVAPLQQTSNPYIPDFIERRALAARQAAETKGNQQLRFHGTEELGKALEVEEQEIRQAQEDNGCS
ncbi:MAG: PAAR domain-containing protein [Pseudomonadota bacterium]